MDSGDYGKITYFLDRQSSTGLFSIDPDTGQLSVQGNLDREATDTYTLIIQAYDNYHFGFTTGDSRSSFRQVVVKVTDVNDEVPIFENDTLSGGDCAIVTEFHTDAILTVRAFDNDDAKTPNGKIDFEIDDGNRLNLFRIDSNPNGNGVAKIHPNLPLKGYYGNYTLTIKATDRGFPQNRAFAEYSICVQVTKSKKNSIRKELD